MADRTIAGNIFNVWKVNVANPLAGTPGAPAIVQQLKQDNLVGFSGKVFGNTAKGTSQLAYGADKNLGTFKGTFYGKDANELGGSVNSVTDAYGKQNWGGVFGAQKGSGNANQSE